jgi:hypothetical protein
MSVIVVADPEGDPLRPLLRALARQTIRDRLELVVVSWGGGTLLEGQDVSGFAAVRSLGGPALRPIGEARAAAVRAATAPAVVFGELHSFPEPGWAEALLRRLDEGWAAAGPIVRNHNPSSAASWAALLTGFGEWLDERRGGRASSLPWHSSAYRRDLLLSRGEALADLLEVEWLLQQALREEGRGFWVEPAARTSHVNVSRLRALPGVEFVSGRLFAGIVAHRRGLSRAGRAALAVTRPVAFVPRLLRVLRRVPAEPDVRRRLPGVLALTAAGVAAHLAGEAVGYAAGAGSAKRRRIDVECRRMRFVREEDRKTWEADARAGASRPA